MNDEISRGDEPIAGQPERVAERTYQLRQRELTTIEQAVPVRVFFGRVIAGGTIITPLFSLGSKTHRGSKK